MATESSFRTDSRQTDRDTPASRTETPRLKTIHEADRGAAPELDRSIDLFIVSHQPVEDKPIFDRILLSRNTDIAREDHFLFTLPANIRQKIYGYCFPHEPRRISLSPRFATKAVFPDDYFASPWDVLDMVFGGLQSFPGLRHELMIYFWTEYHFHVTLSPFSGPKFSPLSNVWYVFFNPIILTL